MGVLAVKGLLTVNGILGPPRGQASGFLLSLSGEVTQSHVVW